MAPNCSRTSNLIYKEVEIGQQPVRALVDSGAEASCCSRRWYEKEKLALGGLMESEQTVRGVSNVLIPVTGRTQPVELTWGAARTTVSLLVVPTLMNQDVILGMDVLRLLGVHIDAKRGIAEPTILPTYVRPKETWRVPAASTVYFSIPNPIPQGIILYEPSNKLPSDVRSRAAVYEGEELLIRIENVGEEDRMLDSGWEIGTVEQVQLEEMEKTEAVKPRIPEDLNSTQKKELERLLEKYKDVFSERTGKIGRTGVIQHEIHTRGAPIRQPYRRQNPFVRQQEQEHVEEMLEQDIIRPSTSPWASPVVMVKKKDGNMRFCVDYRKLNSVTEKDAYPLPRIDDTLESLNGSHYFSTLDLKSGYWQVPVREEDRKKTAFRTSAGRLYEWNRLPFGLCNAPATFSRLMDHVLTGLSWEICLFYLDDIIVFSKTWEEHLARLEIVFQRLLDEGLTLGATKCRIAAKEVEFLGHVVNKEGLRPNPALLKSIAQISQPRTVKEVRSFLGLASYYRRFVEGFSGIAAPLNRLLEKGKDKEVCWTPECEAAFCELKERLMKAPVTAYPDFNLPFRLYTDASNQGLGAILAQVQEGKERIICCASRSLNKSEQNYPATKKECLAVVWGIKSFRSYLMPRHFEIFTDHYSLQWLRSMKSENALLYRWAASLEDYDFEVKHRPGKKQGHVDALSRLLVLEEEPRRGLDEEETRRALTRIHQDGHLGLKKTLGMFRERFKGVREHAQCEKVIKECSNCQKGTDYRPHRKIGGHINSAGPWELLSVDVVGPLPVSQEGYRFILSVIDCYSRYVVLVPLRDHKAETVSKALYENVIAYFGTPQGILSDRGVEFRSNVWTELLKLLDIKPHLTSPYYPQGNGIIERMHRTLGNLIRARLIDRKDREWPLMLPGVMLTLNEAPQENHGYSPNQVVCGHRVRLPVDLIWPNTHRTKGTEEFVKQTRERLEKVRKEVTPYNQREGIGINPFKEGDMILVLKQRFEKESKFDANWKGPYKVTRVHTRHQVEYLDEGGVARITNVTYCKKHIPSVTLHKLIIRTDRKKYIAQSVRDLKRLISKDRIKDEVMLTVEAQLAPESKKRGTELAEAAEGLFEEDGEWERWLTWKEMKERCGARSSWKGVKCKAENRERNRQENEPSSQQNIDPFNFITSKTIFENLNGKKKNVDLFLKLRDFSREGIKYKADGSQECRHGIRGKTSKPSNQDQQELRNCGLAGARRRLATSDSLHEAVLTIKEDRERGRIALLNYIKGTRNTKVKATC